MDRRGAALPDADESDKHCPALQTLKRIVLHLTALAETKAVHLASGDHGRGAHPCSALQKITTIQI
jgi:hypothetical protein